MKREATTQPLGQLFSQKLCARLTRRTMTKFSVSQLTIGYIFINYSLLCVFGEIIDCSLASNCAGRYIYCNRTNSDAECEIQCSEEASCKGSIIHCAPNKDCQITCSNPFACQSSTIYCPNTTNNQCNIDGLRPYSLHSAKINCMSNCEANCHGIASCLNTTFNGSHPNANLEISCNDNARDPGTTVT